jgi:hypothetical protein
MHCARLSILFIGLMVSATGCGSETVPIPVESATAPDADAQIPVPVSKKSKPQKRIRDPTKLAPLHSKTFQPDI